MTAQLLAKNECPDWFQYPQEFVRIVNQGLLDFDPWFVLQAEMLRDRLRGLGERYPSRSLVPFARRADNDDVACWEKHKPGIVVIVHDFASPGWEARDEFPSFWDWLRSALETTIAFE